MGSLRPGPRDAGDVQLGGSHASWGGECVLGGLVCYDYGLDEGSVQNVAAALFVGLVVAWAVAIFASYASRRGARSDMGYYFSAGCLLGLVCVQWYYVFLAANHAPPSVMPAHTRRYDCERSRKGGKRSTVDRLNPAGGTVSVLLPPLRAVRRPRHGPRLPRGRRDARGRPVPGRRLGVLPGARRPVRAPLDPRARDPADGPGLPPRPRRRVHGAGPLHAVRGRGRRAGPPRGLLLGLHGRRPGKCLFTQGVGPYCKDGHGGVRPCGRRAARRRARSSSTRTSGRGAPARRASSGRSSGALAVHPKWRPSFCKKTPAETCELAGAVTALAQEADPRARDERRDGPVDARRRDGPGPAGRTITGSCSRRPTVLMDLTRHGPGNATAAIAACAGGLPATPAPAPSPEPTPALGDLDT